MTSKEKYEALEAKKEKLIQEYTNLYNKIDQLRVKMNQVEAETQAAYMKYLSERKK
jgi:outer membrane murein-binding lipoprotein Lpp